MNQLKIVRSLHSVGSNNVNNFENREHTRYVFTLLSSRVRLCERCKYTTPKYALVTELKAKARYHLDDKNLLSLPFKKVRIKKFCVHFFLRLEVEELAHVRQVKFEGGDLALDIHKEEKKTSNVVDMNCSKSSSEE
jgi:hypothetical protein